MIGFVMVIFIVAVLFLQVFTLFFINMTAEKIDSLSMGLCISPEETQESSSGDIFYEEQKPDKEELRHMKIMENINNFGTNKRQEEIT